MKKASTIFLLAIFAVVLFQGIGNCFGQDTLAPKKQYFPVQRNILIVESTEINSWLPPQSCYFKVRCRVQLITRTNNTKERGHIQFISDSSIFLNGKEIKLKDIVTIKKVRGEEVSVVGGSLTAIGLIFSISSFARLPDIENTGAFVGTVIGTLVAGIFTLVGVIQVGSAHRYQMQEGWKFNVKPEVFENPMKMKFPGKSDTVNGNNPFKPGNSMNRPTPFPKKKKKETEK